MIGLFKNGLKLIVALICNVIFLGVLFTQPKTVTILHTNDIQAGFIPHEATWVKEKPKPLIGGFNELSYAVDSLRCIKNWTILLDAGDIMTGNPITEYKYGGAEGGALFEMMNLVGYDAFSPGNHEFDISQENFRRLIKIARFSTLAANVVDTTGQLFVPRSGFFILERNEIKIGFIGIMSNQFHELVNKRNGEGIVILSPIAALQKWVDSLKQYVDIIVALTHEGINDDSVLAMNVKGLDIIVGGHSHTVLRHPKVVNGVIIVQAGSHCENLGILDLTIENRRIIKYNGELLPLWYNSARGTTPLSMFIDSMKNRIDIDYGEVLGTLKTDWTRRNGESGIGNFVTDAQKEAAGADIGLMNNYGIRKDISAGPITKLDVFEMLPFRNVLTKFEITGKQIRDIVRYEIEKGPVIQTSGIRCKWRYGDNGEILFISFLVNGKPVNDEKIYSGAANDYLVGVMPKYIDFEITGITYLDQTISTAVEKKIRDMKEIRSVTEHRIRKVK
jgi:2',3'-cyclic-nucleotide 2'-phosphodiesterase (5'-nucleotidase family)